LFLSVGEIESARLRPHSSETYSSRLNEIDQDGVEIGCCLLHEEEQGRAMILKLVLIGWAAPLDGKLYVVTAKSTGKARRVRATGRGGAPPE